MTAPEPPAVWWSPAKRTLIGVQGVGWWEDQTSLDTPVLPADAVRLVPDEPRHEVTCPSCGATIRARMADAPAEGVAPPGIDWRAAYEETVGPAARAQYLDDRVAALLRRCDEVEADPRGGWLLLTHDIRALLGGADNNNEGER